MCHIRGGGYSKAGWAATTMPLPKTGPERGGKSSFSIALIRATSRWIPASTSANHGPEKGDLIPLRGLVVSRTIFEFTNPHIKAN